MAKDRFEKIYSKGSLTTENQIWVDTETGVQYFWHSSGYGGGLTIIVDRDGKPLIYTENNFEGK